MVTYLIFGNLCILNHQHIYFFLTLRSSTRMYLDNGKSKKYKVQLIIKYKTIFRKKSLDMNEENRLFLFLEQVFFQQSVI